MGDADCRERLLQFQQDALRRREELLPRRRFTVPDVNHTNARIVRLPEPARALALERLSEWMGVPPGARASALAAGVEAAGGEDVAPLVEGQPWL